MSEGESEGAVWIESPAVRRVHTGLANRLGWGALACLLLSTPLGILATRLLGAGFGNAIIYAFLLAPVLALASFVARRLRRGGAAAIGVTRGALEIVRGRARTRIPLAELASGWSSPARGEVDLVLRRGDTIHAAIADSADAERLLVAAGLDASKRTLRIKLGETTFYDILLILLGPALVLPITESIVKATPFPWWVGVPIFLLLFALLFRVVHALLGPAHVVVGADGVIVEHGFRKRFVPHDRLASVEVKKGNVELLLTDGARVRARGNHLTAEQQGELRTRIEAALAASRRGALAAESLARLDRGGRPLAAWRTALQALLADNGSYRAPPLSRDQLFDVLESAAAPAERRLAAALSLQAVGGDEEVGARIRVAAEACANARVRIALTRVAEGEIDDSTIEAAIAEDEAARARR